MLRRTALLLLLLSVVAGCLAGEKAGSGASSKKAKKKKSILDYSEKDFDALSREWEDEEEQNDPDNFPPKPKPAAPFDPSKLTGKSEDVEAMLRSSKKGKTLMVFVKVSDAPTKAETEKLTGRWEEMLRNGGIVIQRFVISDDRAIFMIEDGSEAWRMKDFLIEQDGCMEVEIEQQKFPGKKPARKRKDEL